MENINLTPATKALFVELAADSGNWNGQPLLDVTAEQRGNVTDLKKQGLITTFKDEGNVWVIFTDLGREYGESIGSPVAPVEY